MAASQMQIFAQFAAQATELCQQKLAVFAELGPKKEENNAVNTNANAAETGYVAVGKDGENVRLPCNLQVSLPHKMLRLASESVETQFARVPSAKQANGTVAACNDYRKLMQCKKLDFWADKILGLGAVGTDERAAAVGAHDADDVKKVETRRQELLAGLHDLLVQHKTAMAMGAKTAL